VRVISKRLGDTVMKKKDAKKAAPKAKPAKAKKK
jgi:hypothetical protein